MPEQQQLPPVELGFDQLVEQHSAELEANERQAVLALERLAKIKPIAGWLAKVKASRGHGQLPNPWSAAFADPLAQRHIEHADRKLAAYLAAAEGRTIAAVDYEEQQRQEKERERQTWAREQIEKGQRMTAEAKLRNREALTRDEMRLLGLIQ